MALRARILEDWFSFSCSIWSLRKEDDITSDLERLARSDLVMVAQGIRGLTLLAGEKSLNKPPMLKTNHSKFCPLRHTDSCVHRITCFVQPKRDKGLQVDENLFRYCCSGIELPRVIGF